MKKLTIFALALSVMVGCSKDDSASIGGESSNVVSFSAGEISRVATATDLETGDYDSWEAGDEIGVFTVGFAGVNDATDYSNVKYIASSTAATTAFTSTSPILFPNTDEADVTFYAYYPYTTPTTYTKSEVDYSVYKMDVSGQGDDYGSVDFMCAEKEVEDYGVGKDVNDTPVALTFYHKLAKVVLNISKQDNLESIYSLTTKFCNVYNYKYYDYKGSEDTDIYTYGTEISKDAITDNSFAVNSTTTKVTAILHPMGSSDCADASIEFTIKEKSDSESTRTCKVNFSGIELEAGSVYTYNIALGNDEPVLSGCTINPWNPGNTTPDELYSTED